MAEMHWNQRVMGQLRECGLSRKQALRVLGMLAEERQIADRQGYERGFESGYAECQKHDELRKELLR